MDVFIHFPSRATPTEIISTSLFSECSLMKLCIGKAGVYSQTGKIRTIFWKLSKSMSNGEMRGSFFFFLSSLAL